MIVLEGIRKSFAHEVLRGIDLVVPEHCLYGLVGPGAAGKSLLLKLMTGLMRPDAGRVLIGGRDLGSLPDQELASLRRGIGMQFQNNALFDALSVAENIAFPLRRMFQLTDEEVQARVAERLQRVALSGFETRLPAGLSGGQKKRVGLARATITRPPIVFYDEPAAGLDPVTSQRIFDLLRSEQRARGATVVMVSSDIDRLLTVTDRVGVLHEGRLVFDGTTQEALQSRQPLVHQFLNGLPDGPI